MCTRSHGVSGVRDFGIGRCGGGGGPALRWELGRVLSIIEVEAFAGNCIVRFLVPTRVIGNT